MAADLHNHHMRVERRSAILALRISCASRVTGQEAGAGSNQDRPVGTQHKNLPCGGRRQEMPLNMRIFVCEGCGYSEHRDVNASHNILEAGRCLRSGASSKTAHGWQDALVTAESRAL